MAESFYTIIGFENYMISEQGKVLNIRNKKYKTPMNNGKGYLYVDLYKNGKYKRFYIHRLVAENFVDNHKNYKEVNHKDGDKQNNIFGNLEWCTRSENLKHAYKNNLRNSDGVSKSVKGEKNRHAKLTKKQVKEIFQKRAEGLTQTELAKMFNIHQTQISRILRKEAWND